LQLSSYKEILCPKFKTVGLLFHELFLAALLCEALPEMHWFKWTYFHDRALLFPLRYCQVLGDANAPTVGTSLSPRLAAVVLCRAAGWRLVVAGNDSAARGNSRYGV
jgi:hypothetical protein